MIEHWTVIRRRDWPHDHGALLARGARIPTPDEKLEVFEVVRADDYQGAVEALAEVLELVDALRVYTPSLSDHAKLTLDNALELTRIGGR